MSGALHVPDRTTELVDWPTTMSDNQVLIRDSTAPTGYRFGDVAGLTASGTETIMYPNATVIQATSTNNAWEIDVLSKTPSGGAEVVNAMACATNTVLDEFWLYDTVLSGTSIPAGVWQHDIYCSVSSTTGGRVSTITQNVYLVDAGAGTVTITGAGTSRTATVTGGTPFVSGDASAFDANGSHRALCGFLRTPLGIFPITGFTSSSVVTIETLGTYANETGVAYTYWRKNHGITTPAIVTTGTDYALVSIQYISAAISLTVTNKLGVATFGVSNNTTTVNFVHDGTAHYSHIHTPLATDISTSIHNAVNKATPVDADEFGIWDSVSTVLNKVTWANIKATLKTYFDTLYSSILSPVTVPVRQTVLYSPVDTSGLPTFLPATVPGSLVIASQNISTGSSSFIVTASQRNADVVGTATANITWPACTNAATNYLPVSISGGVITAQTPVTLTPIYQWGGTPAVTAGQYTFNIQEMTMYLGNGATAPAVNHVIVGEAVAAGGAITSTIAYALQGRYDSGYTATLPTLGTPVSKNHNIGTDLVNVSLVVENTTTEHNYAVGDDSPDLGTGATAAPPYTTPVRKVFTRLTCGFAGTGGWFLSNKNTGVDSVLTAANWKWKLTARRSF